MTNATAPVRAPLESWTHAHELYLNGQYARAKLLLEPLVAAYPQDRHANSLHSMVYAHFGEPLRAAEHLSHDPNWQALLLALTGEYRSAKRLLGRQTSQTLADEQLILLTHAALALHEQTPTIAQQYLTDAWSIDQRDEKHAQMTELLDTERHAIMLALSVQTMQQATNLDQARRYVLLSQHTHPRTPLLNRTQRLSEQWIDLDMSNPETLAEFQNQVRRCANNNDHFNLLLYGPAALEALGATHDIRGIDTLRPLLPDTITVNLAHGIALALSYQSPEGLLDDPLESPWLEQRRAAYHDAASDAPEQTGPAESERVTAPRHLTPADRKRINGIRERRASADPAAQRTHVLNLGLIGPNLSLRNGRRTVKLPEKATRLLAHLVITNRTEQRNYSSDELIPALLGEPLHDDPKMRRTQKVCISKAIWQIRHHLGQDTVLTEDDRYLLNLRQPLVLDTDSAERAIASRDVHSAATLLAGHVLPDEPEDTVLGQWKERLYRCFFLTVEENLNKTMSSREKHALSLALAPFLNWNNDPMVEELAAHCLELLRQKTTTEHS